MSDDAPLLEVRNLTKHYPVTEGVLKREVGRIRAVDGVGFTIERGETLGLVGESGCGKSTAATTLLRLDEPTDGRVLFEGRDVTSFDGRELKRFRREAQMVFQDAAGGFDPRMTVGESVAEPLRIHGMRDGARRRRIVTDLLERVGLSASDADRYPHEFSGGQRQRLALARALSLNPSLLVADEPVSALDASVRAEILSLMRSVQEEFGLGMLFVSHDLSVVREVCDRVAVMYLGEIVELAETEELFENPRHPYTEALLSSIPVADPRERNRGGIELLGDVPSPRNPPPGCRFHTRCPKVIPPEEYELGESEWRAVLNLRVALRRSELDADARDEREIRRAFDVPETLSDEEAERRLSDALETLVAGDADGRRPSGGRGSLGDAEAARSALAEAFETVCETDAPELRDAPGGGRAACHLVGDGSESDSERSEGD